MILRVWQNNELFSFLNKNTFIKSEFDNKNMIWLKNKRKMFIYYK